MAQDKPKTRLVDLVLNEVSFVPAGDNPEAKVMLMKSKPNQGTTMDAENAETVSKADHAAEVAKREALEKQLNDLLEKNALADITKSAAEYDCADIAPTLRTIQKIDSAAFDAVVAKLKANHKQLAAVSKLTTRFSGDGKPVTAGSAAQKFDQAVTEEMKKSKVDYAKASDIVAKANPALYTDYLSEVRS